METDVRYDASQIQLAAAAVGTAFLVVGIAGFIPGVTTHYGDLQLAGHDSGAKLLGLFQVSVLHNLIHLAFAAAGLLLARTAAGARAYLVGGGLVYLLVFLYGLVVGQHDQANFVPLNDADDVLHLVLGGGMVLLGLLLGRPRPIGD
ncbi:DUF4383 domain-containing protein [Nocardioides jiangxiensis]|uniref:DUF4383 domain-containing protein n=1 Tax=Nocardioides jiangxiensis TaxID=3064524 RepID=A0ABT9B4P7_9ACTN|nr:DUF4383 domain-containing protein [Nocardioides sp. WY-20]MDO7868128.1 DUF4383 domain-containing protein [Nocardioides sp. WY-20]